MLAGIAVFSIALFAMTAAGNAVLGAGVDGVRFQWIHTTSRSMKK